MRVGTLTSRPTPTSSGVSPLSPAELIVIANFMANRGGVFAVGDHDGLGRFMGGDMLRVRTMRKWFVIGDPANTPDPAADRARLNIRLTARTKLFGPRTRSRARPPQVR